MGWDWDWDFFSCFITGSSTVTCWDDIARNQFFCWFISQNLDKCELMNNSSRYLYSFFTWPFFRATLKPPGWFLDPPRCIQLQEMGDWLENQARRAAHRQVLWIRIFINVFFSESTSSVYSFRAATVYMYIKHCKHVTICQSGNEKFT